MSILDMIIKVADQAYPDGLVQQAYDGEYPGDGLATFIATEIQEVLEGHDSPKMQFEEALRAMESALDELRSVVSALEACRFAFVCPKKELARHAASKHAIIREIVAERLKLNV